MSAPVQQVNTLALHQKRKEIEMRLAYEADTSSREHLANMYNQHKKKEVQFKNKVENILSDHEEKLKERINRRKLKTATYRSRPQDTSDTFPIEENSSPKRADEEPYSPRQKVVDFESGRKPQKHRSMEPKSVHDLKL